MKSTLGLRILCVDDDDEIREMLGAIFQGEGYEVSLAATSRDALQMLSDRHHHLVITDYRLPDENGAWMLREAAARGLLRDTGGAIITAGPTPPDASNVRVYKKPLDVDDFVSKVDLILAPAREAEVDKARRNLAGLNQPVARHVSTRRIELTLYISTASPSSLKALRNLQRLLEEFEPRHVVLDVCDLSREMPPSVEEDRIAFTPTLVKRFPEPRAWILGDLEDSKVVTDLMVHSGIERKK